MKKIIMTCAAILAVASFATAQTVENSKLTDNWFFGIDAGAGIKTTNSDKFGDTRALVGAKVGRYLTPVFGLRADGQFHINTTGAKTAFDMSNVSLDGLFNLNNLFSGYKGEPRTFEVVGILGAGWFHTYDVVTNKMSTKGGLQLNLNFGSAKEWQFNLEPSVVYTFGGGNGHSALNINRSYCQLTAGLTYKFKCSNGTHNFVLAKGYDQSEIDQLNAKINQQMNELNNKDSQISQDNQVIEELKQKLSDCESTPKQQIVEEVKDVNLAPVVIFRQGKSTVDAAQEPNIQMIATYMKNNPDSKITIKGYASPEGNAELNQKLSEKRAEAVESILIKRYKISKDRISIKGLGATNELFDENDWNRVCTFIENNK